MNETDREPESDPLLGEDGAIPADERGLALAAHLLGLFTGFVGPLIMFLVLAEQPAAKREAREALNFQLTVLIGYAICVPLTFVCVGYFLALAIMLLALLWSILGAIGAGQGRAYRYPVTLRMIPG